MFAPPTVSETSIARSVVLGMPQMALGRLSENWLLKELGDLHWERLCRSLGVRSDEITDSADRRLYATFVRVRLQFADSLADFVEGDELRFAIGLRRYGRASVLSTIKVVGSTSSATATMLSTFSFRSENDNTSLARSEPRAEFDASIRPVTETPAFFAEYSTIRKRYATSTAAQSGGAKASYRLNPFTDSNGAGLLYFASYQSTHDMLSLPASEQPTKRRDIYYFRNSGLDDTIEMARAEAGDLLFRRSDGAAIALVMIAR